MEKNSYNAEKALESETVAVLENEENGEELKKKAVALAEEYLSFNNNETRLEKDLSDMLEKINYLEKTSPSLDFLKGQLCLELHEVYKNSGEKEKNALADIFLTHANDSFLESANGEDFEITVKNEEGDNVDFADKSQAFAFLGDIAAKDFYKSGGEADWNSNLKYYKKAIETEKDEGKKHELKVIMDIRKIAHYLGDENKLKVWKTPRRIDLRGRTADFSLKYNSDNNGTINKHIDATKKEKNKQWGDTAVLRLEKEIADFLANVDFETLLKEANEKGELSEKNKKLFRAILRHALATSVELEKALKDEIKNNTDYFRNDFYRNPAKLKNFLPKYSEKELSKIMFE